MRYLLLRAAQILGQPAVIRLAAPVLALRHVFGIPPKIADLAEASQILVIRPDEIGDVILTVPFLRALRQATPRAEITLITKTTCLELVEYCPYVDHVFAVDFSSGGRRPFRLLRAAWRSCLNREKCRPWGFDLVLLPRRASDYYASELLGHLLVGRGAILAHREKAEADGSGEQYRPGRVVYYSNRHFEHEVLHNLRFLQWCGANEPGSGSLELWLSDADRNFAARNLPDTERYVAIAPSAARPERRWPVGRFAEVASTLHAVYGLTPVQLGASGDPHFVGGVNLIGGTTLREAAAVIERCVLFLGNDSGLAHLAAAVGVPVVEVSGFRRGGSAGHVNSPDRFRPWAVPCRVVQPPPGQGDLAIEEVAVEAVRAACSELLVDAGGAVHRNVSSA
jgi:heptosyltransferase-2